MPLKIRLRRWSLTLHNWVGLLIAVQILFWCVGGAVMTVIPLELVRGEVNMAERDAPSFSAAEVSTALAGLDGENLTALRPRLIAGARYLEASLVDGGRKLIEPTTGDLVEAIGPSLAREIALADFQYRAPLEREVAVVSSLLLTEEPGDFRRKLPVWQITLDDPDGTRIYVSPESGAVLARRNDYWRVFDFFWMLHIMDYDTRDDFNNPLVITAAITSTLFVITGFILLYFRFWPGARGRKIG